MLVDASNGSKAATGGYWRTKQKCRTAGLLLAVAGNRATSYSSRWSAGCPPSIGSWRQRARSASRVVRDSPFRSAHPPATPLPRLRIFPAHIFRVVEVQQQAFAAVEEAAAQNVVVEKRQAWADDDIHQAETALTLGDRHLCSQRRVAVHVVEVAIERGIGVVQKMVLQSCGGAVQANVFVDQPILELAHPTAKKTQLGIRIEATMANPAAEEEVLAGHPEARHFRIRNQCHPDLLRQCGLDLFVGVEREHP